MKLKQPFSAFLILGIGIICTACGAPSAHQLTPEQEASQLMDKGNNAQAALVLEAELNKNPDNLKAKKLLGSAYVGLAGIDIYSIQEAFEDVLFRKSLKDQIFSSPSNPNNANAKADEHPELTGGERIIKRLDDGLVSLQKILVYFARFPQVPLAKWPYLDKALSVLEGVNQTSDTAVYRILIRMIYVKSYLVENIIKDENFGTKKWACTVDTSNLQEGMGFVNVQLDGVRTDLDFAIKLGAKRLSKATGIINTLTSQADISDAILALQESRTIDEGESRLRSLFGCEKI